MMMTDAAVAPGPQFMQVAGTPGQVKIIYNFLLNFLSVYVHQKGRRMLQNMHFET